MTRRRWLRRPDTRWSPTVGQLRCNLCGRLIGDNSQARQNHERVHLREHLEERT